MICSQILKKALILSAFFVLVFWFSPLVYAQSCDYDFQSTAETAHVKWVYDGDTLLLDDERKIRIIGIDTPETRHYKQAAEAYGAKAREALRELLQRYDYKVALYYGKERLDRYGRTLAHVILPDGTNVSQWLLQQGFAHTMVIPPNVQLADCYQKAQASAKAQRLRIWRLKNHQLQETATLSARRKGFVNLKGKVIGVKITRKSIFLELDSPFKRPIKIRIKKDDLGYFRAFDPDRLWGQTIEVTGLLKKRHGRRTIYVSHPSQIQLPVVAKNQGARLAPMIKWSSPQ